MRLWFKRTHSAAIVIYTFTFNLKNIALKYSSHLSQLSKKNFCHIEELAADTCRARKQRHWTCHCLCTIGDTSPVWPAIVTTEVGMGVISCGGEFNTHIEVWKVKSEKLPDSARRPYYTFRSKNNLIYHDVRRYGIAVTCFDSQRRDSYQLVC